MKTPRFAVAALVCLVTIFAWQWVPVRANQSSWIQLFPALGVTPPPRDFGASVIGDGFGNLILFGGRTSGGTTYNDVWVLSNANMQPGYPVVWNQRPTFGTPPSPRFNAGVAYDRDYNRLIVFGGCSGGCFPVTNDVWVLTNANGTQAGVSVWTKLTPSGTPPAPRHAALVTYDELTRHLIVFGGHDGSGSFAGTFTDVWALENGDGVGGTSQWSPIVASGTPHPGGYFASGGYDPGTDELIVSGGYNSSTQQTNAVHVLQNALNGPATWINTVAEGSAGSPPPFALMRGTYDAPRHRLLVTIPNGVSGTHDVWALANGTDWKQYAIPSGPSSSNAAVQGVGYEQFSTVLTGYFAGPAGTNFSWAVPLDQLPQFVSPTPDEGSTITVRQGQHVSFTVTAEDADATDTAYIDSGTLPAYSTLSSSGPGNPVTRVFDWDTSNFSGTFDFTFTVYSTFLPGSDTRHFSVVVTPDTGPSFVSPPSPTQGFYVTTGMPISFTVQAADPDPGDVAFLTIDYDLSNIPSGAVITGGGSQPYQVSWTPGPNQAGNYGIHFRATDQAGQFLFYSVSMIVAQNHPPEWQQPPSTFNVTAGTPLTFFARALDVADNQFGHIVTATVDVSTVPPGATASATAPFGYEASVEFHWTPGSNQLGTHTIHYTASDQYGASSDYYFGVNVTAPTLVSVSVSPSAASKHAGQGQSFQATGHFSDGSTQLLPSGPPNTVLSGGALWETLFSTGLDVSACSTPQYPNMQSWSSQVFSDQNGTVDEYWSPGTPVLHLAGSISASQVFINLSCTNGNMFGFINATWTGTRYEGSFGFGSSSGQVSIRGWSTQTPMPTGRYSFGAAAIFNQIYAIGGASGLNLLNTTEMLYPPSQSGWIQLAPMPTAREGLGVAAIGSNFIYAVGGHTAGSIPTGVVEVYNPSSNQWFTGLAPMPTPRAHFMTAVAGNMLYVFGGDTNPDNSGITNTVERYDPVTDTWTTLAPMPTARSFGLAASLENGTIAVLGGATTGGNTAANEIYDIATNTWSAGVAMPAARAAFNGGFTNGGLFIFGGTTNGSPNGSTLVYVPATQNTTDGWSMLGGMPSPRWELAAAVVGDVVYGIGGQATNQQPIPGMTTLTALSTPPASVFQLGATQPSTLPNVQWSSTDTTVATIDASGFASGLATGQTTIVAAAGGISCQATNTCATLTVTNNPPNVSINGGPFTVTEGNSTPLSSTVSDPDGDSVSVQWSIISGPGTLNSPNSFSTGFNSTDGPADTVVRLTATDSHGASAFAETTIHTNNKNPQVQIFSGGGGPSEGGTYSNGGSFTDVIADTFTATVNYGDGSGAQPLSFTGTGQTKNFSLSHLYASFGNYTITVTVTDDDLGVGTATRSLFVSNVPPTVFINGSSTPVPFGQPVIRNGGFTDPGVNNWTATVDYGDGGGQQPLALSGKTFTLNHNYSSAGNFTIVVRVSDGQATNQAQTQVTVESVPSFSLPANVPSGECICTPVAHISQGPLQTWYVKSDASGQLTTTLVIVGDFQGTAQTMQSRVSDLSGNTLAQTQLSLPAGQPDNTQVRSAMVVATTPDTVYRVQVASASTGNPARYFLRFDGAQEAGASTPTPAIEGGFSTWLFNVDANDTLGVMISTQGLFQPPAGSTTMHYQWIAPDGTELPVQALVVTLPGPPNPVNQIIPPPATVTPGVWRLRHDFDYDYVLGKFTGADQSVYVDHRSGGRGAIKVNLVDGHGNPFLGNVSFTASFGSFAFGSFDTNTGEFFVDSAEPFTYHLDVTAPAGYTVSNPSFDIVVACDKTAEITVVISDTTPPVMTNVPGDATIQAPTNAGVVYTFAAPTAVDGIDGPLQVTCTPASGSVFPVTTTQVDCVATDAAGNSTHGRFNVTVTAPVQQNPPAISVSLSPNSIWPPNHKMVNVAATITASSPSGHATTVTLVSVTSNEPDNGLGDGDTANDVQGVSAGTDDRAFQVRAERSGGGSGRVYSATYRATDTVTGLSTTATATVVVPLNQGK